MGLRSLRLPQATIKLSDGQSFTVRGLSLPDVSALADKHGPTMGMLYQRFVTREDDVQLRDMAVMGKTVLEIAPDLAVSIIAYAADDPDSADDVVAKLPFPVQLEALQAIFGLTFTSEEQWGNVLEIVINAAEKGMKALQQVSMPVQGLADQLGISVPGFAASGVPSVS